MSNFLVLVGMALQVFSVFLYRNDARSVGIMLGIAGTVAFLWGCCYFAKGKGYPAALGFLGLLWLIGLIILVALPDRTR